MTPLIPGCNYHTKWQSDSRMRFVLAYSNEKHSWVFTRTNPKIFRTNTEDLIFIDSKYNIDKAKEMYEELGNQIKLIDRSEK